MDSVGLALLLASAVGLGSAASFQHDFDGDFEIPLFVGTPPQGPFRFQFRPVASYKYEPTAPVLPSLQNGGHFNPNASTTFEFKETAEDGKSINGSDVLKMGGLTLPRGIVNISSVAEKPKIGLAVKMGDEEEETFMDGLFAALKSPKSVILAIRNSTGATPQSHHHQGSIVIGDLDPKICATKWIHYSAIRAYNFEAVFKYDIAMVGNHNLEAFGEMTFDEFDFFLDTKTFFAAARQLGVNLKTFQMDCRQTTPIIIIARSMKWTLGPEIYMRTDSDGKCWYSAQWDGSHPIIRLPIRVLNGWCLGYGLNEKSFSASFAKIRD